MHTVTFLDARAALRASVSHLSLSVTKGEGAGETALGALVKAPL